MGAAGVEAILIVKDEAAAFTATLTTFTGTHVAVYWFVRSLVH